jgi:hypothetical protein
MTCDTIQTNFLDGALFGVIAKQPSKLSQSFVQYVHGIAEGDAVINNCWFSMSGMFKTKQKKIGRFFLFPMPVMLLTPPQSRQPATGMNALVVRLIFCMVARKSDTINRFLHGRTGGVKLDHNLVPNFLSHATLRRV